MLVTLQTEMQKTLLIPECLILKYHANLCTVMQLSVSALLQSSFSIILSVKYKNTNSMPGLILLSKNFVLFFILCLSGI